MKHVFHAWISPAPGFAQEIVPLSVLDLTGPSLEDQLWQAVREMDVCRSQGHPVARVMDLREWLGSRARYTSTIFRELTHEVNNRMDLVGDSAK